MALEARAGRPVHFCVCSHGEAGTHGTPIERDAEARNAAALLGASIEFVELDGDAHLEVRAAHAIKLAGIIRHRRPAILFAPSTEENQHPDHFRLGQLVRDAARLARYGGLKELKGLPPHAISQLYFYALNRESEPTDIPPILVDVSAPEILSAWTAAMEAHATQMRARNYAELQLARARVQGLRAGVHSAIAIYPNDAIVVDSLSQLGRGARRF